ncbi:alpha-1,2-fucosyltransferase [Pedobacter sp. MC2016-24]|nr:alpha-1,2-fucosyltransferase [Pedobacter sp. MC2016-24]
MIGVEYKGRLGNQLFQFVFYQYLKSKKRSTLFFLQNPHHASVTKYFDLEPDGSNTGTRFYEIFTRLLVKFVKFKHIYMQNFVGPREILPQDNTIYHGYFQTDWYLNQLKGRISLKVKEKYFKDFCSKFDPIFKNHKTIVIHIRRTDYLSYGKRDISLPVSHFQAQLKTIADIETYKVIFVSDDMEFVKKEFPKQPNYIFSSNDEITDFQLIQHADIAIISNSTFAWWAAYLSPKNNYVIAPKNWMGFRLGRSHPKGIMTEKFYWAEVTD